MKTITCTSFGVFPKSNSNTTNLVILRQGLGLKDLNVNARQVSIFKNSICVMVGRLSSREFKLKVVTPKEAR